MVGKMKPLVSVIIPAYNAGGFIEASAGSVLGQSFGDLEAIVVDDGSTDDTVDRLKAWTDPRLRVITQANQGTVAAYNAGIRASQGDYLGFLDADDVWLPEKLARHVRFLEEHPEIDVTFSWVRAIDGRGLPVPIACPRWRGAVSFPQLLADYMVRTMSAVVMRRAAAEEAGMFDSKFLRCVDVEFLLRAALLRPNNFHAIPEVLCLYRRHDSQRTHDWRLMRDGWEQVLRSIRLRAPAEVAGAEKLASSNMYRYFASLAYESGNFREALGLVRQSFTAYPSAFLLDGRNWKASAAVAAGVILPKRILFAFEKMAGFDRQKDAC
jgi:glycosyltransferase involved in cell wall biosynthesis